MKIISVFDYTARMVEPWLEAGFECWCVDLQHRRGVTKRGRLTLVGADVHELHRDHWWLPQDDVFAVFGFPDCTFLTGSGNGWQERRGPGGVGRGLLLVDAVWRLALSYRVRWMLENPAVGKLSSGWRKPDHTFDPYEFSGYLRVDDPTPLAPHDAYSKATGLWVGNGFVMPEKRPWTGEISQAVWKLPPSKERHNLRSVTPMGFARAVFAANAPQKG